MAMDLFRNFAYGGVLIPPTPPNLGTQLTVYGGNSNRFPAPPFSASIWPLGLPADPTNAEIIRVTAIAGDVWTIVRQQEGTAARAILVNDQIAQALTVKALADLKADSLAAAQNWVNGQGFATQAWVNGLGLATQAWVTGQGFATGSYVDANDAAVKTWAQGQFLPLYPRIAPVNSAAQVFPYTDTTDIITINAQAEPLAMQDPFGTFHEGQALIIRIRDNNTARSIWWSGAYISQNAYAPLPTTTAPFHTLHCAFRFNQLYVKWALVALAQE
jgi:hypothetical protein